MATTISNKRTLADVRLVGESIVLNAQVQLDSSGKVLSIDGGKITLKNDVYSDIGNFSMLAVNIYDAKNMSYRTEASCLADQMVSDINSGKAIENKEEETV